MQQQKKTVSTRKRAFSQDKHTSQRGTNVIMLPLHKVTAHQYIIHVSLPPKSHLCLRFLRDPNHKECDSSPEIMVLHTGHQMRKLLHRGVLVLWCQDRPQKMKSGVQTGVTDRKQQQVVHKQKKNERGRRGSEEHTRIPRGHHSQRDYRHSARCQRVSRNESGRGSFF